MSVGTHARLAKDPQVCTSQGPWVDLTYSFPYLSPFTAPPQPQIWAGQGISCLASKLLCSVILVR